MIPPAASASAPRAPLAPVTALTLTLALGLSAVAICVVMLLSHPPPLPPLLALGAHNLEETALYLLAFGVILPAAVVVVPRVADAIAAGPNRDALSAAAGLLAAGLAGSLLVAQRWPRHGLVATLVLMAVWWPAAIGVLHRLTRGTEPPWLARTARHEALVWSAAGGLAVLALLAFTAVRSISLPVLALGAVAGAGAVLLHSRAAGHTRAAAGRWAVALDAAIVAVLMLAIPDVVFVPAHTPADHLTAFTTAVVRLHHNVWLGPANEVLAGRPLLLGNACQYGIAPVYLIAAWFQVAPIGYGTFALFDGLLFALFFAAGYAVLRVAATPRWLSAATLALGVVVLLYNLPYPVGSLPQHGPLRFGLPMVLVLAAVVGARRRSPAARAVALGAVGLSSVWAFEAFVYTAATFIAIVWLEAALRPRGDRLGWARRRVLTAAAAAVAAQVALFAATLLAAGHAPRYGEYLIYMREFFFGEVAKLTYDFSPWSPGLPVGAAYLASAAALVLLVRRRPDLAVRERAAVVALAGTSAYGVALYSYFVNRSADHIVAYVGLPAVLSAALWLGLLLRGALTDSRRARTGGLGFAAGVALLLVAVAWSSVGERFGRSALGHLRPGAQPSLAAALNRLWHLPPLDAPAARGEALARRYWPHERRMAILVSPDVGTEVLIGSRHANRLPFSDPFSDSFVHAPPMPDARRSVAGLRPGERLLLQPAGLALLPQLRRRSFTEIAARPLTNASVLTEGQQRVLKLIDERFGLRVVHRAPPHFVVVALVARQRRAGPARR